MSDVLPRARDAKGTREAILQSAKQAFSEGGADVGVREIAARAGANSSLINRYFGSKEKLLEEVMCSVPVDFAAVLRRDRGRFGVTIARGLMANCRAAAEFDPTLVMVRSLGSGDGAAVVSALLETWLDPLADALGGSGGRLRAELIVSAIAGFQIFARVLLTRGVGEAEEGEVVALLGATIQSYVDGA